MLLSASLDRLPRIPDRIFLQSVSAKDAFLCSRVEEFLGQSEEFYPEIRDWWSGRVLPALQGERVCYAAIEAEQIVGLCIGKLSTRSTKLCTLRVDPSVQGRGVGTLLLGQLFSDIKELKAARVHFTISEAVDRRCGAFFRGLGFVRQGRLRRPGRDAGDEFIYVRSAI